jgi:hypothetical protein
MAACQHGISISWRRQARGGISIAGEKYEHIDIIAARNMAVTAPYACRYHLVVSGALMGGAFCLFGFR